MFETHRLTSRKFLLAVFTVLVDLIFVFTGIEVDPEMLISLHSIVATWIAGETVLDKRNIDADTRWLKAMFMQQSQALAKELQGFAQGGNPPGAGPLSAFGGGVDFDTVEPDANLFDPSGI